MSMTPRAAEIAQGSGSTTLVLLLATLFFHVLSLPLVCGTDPRHAITSNAVAVEMGLETAAPTPINLNPMLPGTVHADDSDASGGSGSSQTSAHSGRNGLDFARKGDGTKGTTTVAAPTPDLRPTPPIRLDADDFSGGSNSSPATSHVRGSSSADGDKTSNLLQDIKPITLVRFNTTRGVLDVDVHYGWAPLGCAQFLSLVMAGFYDGCYIFRVIQGFVAQAGLNSDPNVQQDYTQLGSIQDDPQGQQSNTLGTLSFATSGPNTRSTQFFWNLIDNTRLDAMGFTPFGKVHEGGGGLEILSAFTSEYGERPDQTKIREQGEAYLKAEFPHLDRIISARILPSS